MRIKHRQLKSSEKKDYGKRNERKEEKNDQMKSNFCAPKRLYPKYWAIYLCEWNAMEVCQQVRRRGSSNNSQDETPSYKYFMTKHTNDSEICIQPHHIKVHSVCGVVRFVVWGASKAVTECKIITESTCFFIATAFNAVHSRLRRCPTTFARYV